MDSKIQDVESQLAADRYRSQPAGRGRQHRQHLPKPKRRWRKRAVIQKNLELTWPPRSRQKKALEKKLYGGTVNNSKELTGFNRRSINWPSSKASSRTRSWR